jgi:hypothetical protein
MSVATTKTDSCRNKLSEFLKDGEGCLMPSAVILESVQNNRNLDNLKNDVAELRNRIAETGSSPEHKKG